MKKFILAALFALAAPIAINAQKFAHFNSNEVVAALPEYATVQNELQTLGKQYEDEIKRTEDELRKKSEEYDKEKANLLDNVRQAKLQVMGIMRARAAAAKAAAEAAKAAETPKA